MAPLFRVLAALVGLTLLLLVLTALRRPLGKLFKLLCKTGVGLGALALLQTFGGALGLALGVNLWNALVIGLLGIPGLGLLLMLNWVAAL